MLGAQRAHPHGELVRMILVLASILAHPGEALADVVTAGQQLFPTLAIAGHGIERVLQNQTRLAELLGLDRTLLCQLGKLRLEALTALQ